MGSYWAQRLSPAARSSLIRQYWSPTDGIGYSVGRVPMAACDYSFSAYSYNEVNNDFNQTYFQLNAEDYKYKVVLVERNYFVMQFPDSHHPRSYTSVWREPQVVLVSMVGPWLDEKYRKHERWRILERRLQWAVLPFICSLFPQVKHA